MVGVRKRLQQPQNSASAQAESAIAQLKAEIDEFYLALKCTDESPAQKLHKFEAFLREKTAPKIVAPPPETSVASHFRKEPPNRKRCDRCNQVIEWRKSSKGNYYWADPKTKRWHEATCNPEQKAEDRKKKAQATRLRLQLDQDFERAILG